MQLKYLLQLYNTLQLALPNNVRAHSVKWQNRYYFGVYSYTTTCGIILRVNVTTKCTLNTFKTFSFVLLLNFGLFRIRITLTEQTRPVRGRRVA